MFSKFRETFVKKPQFTSRVPDSVLKTVGKNLPDGFRYVEDHNGYCRLDCDGTLDITGFNAVLPKESLYFSRYTHLFIQHADSDQALS